MLRESGYAVNEATDGEDGLFKATSWGYDAIVLDLLMPKLTGWEVLERLRQTHRTPVLILTARDGVNDRIRGLDGGADDYLAKPFHLAELKARLRALIRRSAGQASSQIQIGELTIDTRKKTVKRAETLLLLTPREYSLLELLALHRGKVVTRTEIYEHLFDETLLRDKVVKAVDLMVSDRRHLGQMVRHPATVHPATARKTIDHREKPDVVEAVKHVDNKAAVKDLVRAGDQELRDGDAVRWGHRIPSDSLKTPCDSTGTATASSTKLS